MFHLDNGSGIDAMPALANKQSNTTKWFTEGDNVNSPSYPGQDWFNITQAELLNVLKASGVMPDKTKLNQLATAIQNMVTNGKPPNATTSIAGITQLGSQIDSDSEKIAATLLAVKTAYDLADDALPKAGGTVTGKTNFTNGLTKSGNDVLTASDFDSLNSESGYCKLPNGLIIQWGVFTANWNWVTFPISFSKYCFSMAIAVNSSSAGSDNILIKSFNNNSFYCYGKAPNSTNIALPGTFIAIGQ